LLGSSIAQFVIIWWITLETGSALYLSLAAVLGLAPMVILTPFAGVFVDRWSRKALIGIADFLQALATAILIFLFWLGGILVWQVLALLTLRGVFQAFHSPAVSAIIPSMVPKDKLSRMNGLNYLFTGAISLIGPVVAALLLGLWKIHQILWIDVATFLVALAPLLIIRIPSIREKLKKSSFTEELTEGFALIKNGRGLLPLLLVATVVNFLLVPLFTLLPYYVKVVHFGVAEDLAFVMAFSAGGTLGGGLLMSAMKGFKKKMVAVTVSIYIIFLGYVLVALTPTGLFWFMAISTLLMHFCAPVANVSIMTIIQTVVPGKMQGRVNSVLTALASGAMPLGMIVSGPLAEYLGTSNLFWDVVYSGY